VYSVYPVYSVYFYSLVYHGLGYVIGSRTNVAA
jgi:hypothetical protein